ncbi:ATP-binding protein [Streptomyces capparidis]
MDGAGAQGFQAANAGPVPRPAAPPPVPARPPAPPGTADLRTWVHTPRPGSAPGIFRFGHVPRPPEDPNRVSNRRLVFGALVAPVVGFALWRLMWLDIIPVWTLAFMIFPVDVTDEGAAGLFWTGCEWLLHLTVLAGVAHLGRWPEVYRRYLEPHLPRAVLALPLIRRFTTPSLLRPEDRPLQQPTPTTTWPALRQAGAHTLADRLDAEVAEGRVNDVEYVRVHRAWENARPDPDRSRALTDALLRRGAAAFAHPSGARDLPVRAARHDLLTRQVRIGAAPDQEKNLWPHRGAAIALDPSLLGTSLLAVGPPGSGKTRAVLRPVVESLNLQALCGTAAVVAVGPPEADLGPAEAFDVVIALGDPTSAYDLDLYGGAADPDEAAACLAEALLPEGLPDSRPARTALSQLLGPFRAAHGRYPAVAELRELLDGVPAAFAALRTAVDEAGAPAHQRDLDARQRLHGRLEDVGPALADRVALLARPAFAGFFDVSGRGRPFSLRALEHPLRVRVVLPTHGHAEASRILTRLLLAQFTASVTARADRSLFACLVLDDATHAVTAETVRGVQRLRSANAGVVLALRTLDDVPEALRGPLLGSVGCHMALSGVTTWDGALFAEAWGKTWVDDSTVTRTPDRYGGSLRRGVNTVRKLITGQAVTTESVTVRKVERERWSASELAHSVPPAHAVASFTSTAGERVPPVLVNLRG